MALARRGVHVPQSKEPALSRPIATLSRAVRVMLPMAYGETPFAAAVKRKGDTAECGELVARPRTEQDTPVLSSVTGKVMGKVLLDHPLFGTLSCVVVDGKEESNDEVSIHRDITDWTPDELCEVARFAAITDEVSGVPLFREFADWATQPIDLLVVDALEHEPYGSASLAVLAAQARQVKEGLLLAKRACGARDAVICVRTTAALTTALKRQIGRKSVRVHRTAAYPNKVFARRRKNVCRIGAQACLALFRAAGYAEPQTSFVLTVAGDGIEHAQNVRVPIGVSAQEVLEFCGIREETRTVVFGDALTGIAGDPRMPLYPITTCLLALSAPAQAKESPCVTCGRCVRACHKGLLPYEIARLCRTAEYDHIDRYHPDRCDACGACSYVCPAGRDVMAHVLEAADNAGAVLREGGEQDA